MASTCFYLSAGAVIAFLLLWIVKPNRLPPGPRPLPLIGNLHQQTSTAPWEKFNDWHKKYGPIISFKLGFRTVISLGTHESVKELLQRRGKNYSSRPRLIWLGEYMSRSHQPGLMPYGPKWQALHQLQMSSLNPRATKAFRLVQDNESKHLLHEVLSGEHVSDSIARFSFNVASTLAYGTRLDLQESDQILEINKFTDQLVQALSPDNALVDLFPPFARLPRWMNRLRAKGDIYFHGLIQQWSRKMTAALERDTWTVTQFLFDKKSPAVSWEELCFVMAEFEMASNLSTPALIEIFITTCGLNSESVAKAQRELDRVIGHERMPAFGDYDQLPYLQAFQNEMLRWRTISPLGGARAVIHEDEYMGYRIPTDAIIIPNHWALNNSHDMFRDPAVFRPERWMEEPDLPKPAIFGFGRRACPGEGMARNSLFILISRLLWAYNITCPDDSTQTLDRADPPPRVILTTPSSKATLQVRSSQHRLTIEREWLSIDKETIDTLSEIKAELIKVV